MASYLIKKRQSWYLRLRIPEDLRDEFPSKNGNPREYIVESLQTRDKAVAEKRKHAKLLYYFAKFEKLREGTPKVNRHDIEWFEHSVYIYAESVKGRAEKPFSGIEPDEYAMLTLEELEKHIDLDRPDIEKRIKEAWKLLDNPHLETISTVVDMYIADKESVLRQATINEKQARLNEFSEWVGKIKPIAHINKPLAREYTTYLSQKQSKKTRRILSKKTVKDTLGDINALFSWAEARGYTKSNPFEKIIQTVKETKRGKRNKREWAPQEIKRFLEASKNDPRVLAIFTIALYTGMRGREIAELKSECATERFLRLDEGKNDNSVREVPVHSIIRPLIMKLKEFNDPDGFLIPGLTIAQPDNNRYKNIGKKIYRLRQEARIPSEVDFHSTRRSTAGALERAGIPLETAARVTGHVPNNGITYSLYSGGITAEQLLATVDKIKYGDGVEEAIKHTLSEVFGI